MLIRTKHQHANYNKKFKPGRDLRMAWELYTNTTLRTYPNWTSEAYNPNNLCSFNATIQNTVSPQQRFTNQTTKSFKCEFLDLHSIKTFI